MLESGRDALPDVWGWWGGPPKCSGVVGRSSRMSLSGESPFWMFGSSQEAPQMSGSARETLPDVPEWLRGPPGCPRVVRRPSRMSGNGREALSNIREWSGDPSGCLGVVGRLSRMSGSGLEALPNVREWLGDPPGC